MRVRQPHYADAYGCIVERDINGKITKLEVSLGTGTPNNTTLYNVADGGAFGRGCELKNLTGKRLNVFYIYRPIETDGNDMGSGLRWINVC